MAAKRSKGDEPKDLDYINTIPDSILSDIVCRLPMKDALRTSFVSPKWKYLWTSITDLDFDDRVFVIYPENLPVMIRNIDVQGRDQQFVDFVDRTLSLHDAPSLKRFCLRFRFARRHRSKVDEWIHFAMAKNVEELDLSLQFLELYELPQILLERGMETLKVLKLSHFVDTTRYHGRGFRLLQILTLEGLVFDGLELKAMLAHCPLLHTLSIIRCVSVYILQIDAPNLRNVKIVADAFRGMFDVRSPCLEFLDYSGWEYRFLLKALTPPKKLVFDLECWYTFPRYDKILENFMWNLLRVTDMTMSMMAAEAICRTIVKVRCARLINLKKLSLTKIRDTEAFFLVIYKKMLHFIFRICPNMESLSLNLCYNQLDPSKHLRLQQFAISVLRSCPSNVKEIEVVTSNKLGVLFCSLYKYDEVSKGWILEEPSYTGSITSFQAGT